MRWYAVVRGGIVLCPIAITVLHTSPRLALPMMRTQELWQYVNQVDSQMQQLRSTQQFLYWRERRHRETVDSTNRRVLWYAVARGGLLVAVSTVQVFFIKRMFSK
jgi:hypothetical protein